MIDSDSVRGNRLVADTCVSTPRLLLTVPNISDRTSGGTFLDAALLLQMSSQIRGLQQELTALKAALYGQVGSQSGQGLIARVTSLESQNRAILEYLNARTNFESLVVNGAPLLPPNTRDYAVAESTRWQIIARKHKLNLD